MKRQDLIKELVLDNGCEFGWLPIFHISYINIFGRREYFRCNKFQTEFSKIVLDSEHCTSIKQASKRWKMD